MYWYWWGNGGLLHCEYTLYMNVGNYCWHVLLLGLEPIFEPTTLLMSPAHHMTKAPEQIRPIISLTGQPHQNPCLLRNGLLPDCTHENHEQ